MIYQKPDRANDSAGDQHPEFAWTHEEGGRRLQQVLDNVYAFVGLVSTNGVLLEANRTPLEVAGLQREDVIGKPFAETYWWSFSPEAQQQLQAAVHRAAQGESVRFDTPVRIAKGQFISIDFSLRPLFDADGRVTELVASAVDITERKNAELELRWKSAFLEALVSSSKDGILVVNDAGKKILQNQRMNELWKIPQAVADDPDDEKQLRFVLTRLKQPKEFVERVAYLYAHPNESSHEEVEIVDDSVLDRYSYPVIGQNGTYYGRIWVFRDITEQKVAEREHERMEVQLRHSQKMESIGQLAAGIAHEINTPTQYIGDNTRFLMDAFGELARLNRLHAELLQAVEEKKATDRMVLELKKAEEASDLEYLTAEVPKAIQQSLEGVDRVTKIVRAMKEFSHPGASVKTAVNINHCIESTLTVCRNEWKYVADMVTDFDPKLPPVSCLPGEINQTILNIVVNAAHAIADVVGDGGKGKGTISVSTRLDGNSVEIRIRDTGTGIPEHVRNRVFDPFFTTKGVGKGTGQGLAIAHSVVVDKHGGAIRFETETGKGTTFIIQLPLVAPAVA